MLLRCIHFHLDGELVVLAQEVLYGVYIVLSHVAQSAAVIVPVSTEGLVGAVHIVRLVGCRAQPQVIVKFFGNGLYLKVLLTCPEEFPGEAGGSADAYLERPAQQSAVHQFLQWLDLGAQSIECVLESEPGIQTEDAALDCFLHPSAFAYGGCHGLLAQDVLTSIGSLYGHDAMPV